MAAMSALVTYSQESPRLKNSVTGSRRTLPLFVSAW